MRPHASEVAVLLIGAFLATAGGAHAQSAVTVLAGPAEYDLAGTGTGATAHVYFESPLESWLRLEYGAGVFSYGPQFGGNSVTVLPEGGLVLQGPLYLPLYLAVGGGYSLSVVGDQGHDSTLYQAVGLNLRFGPARIRPEMRVRWVDRFAGTIVGYTLGLTLPLS